MILYPYSHADKLQCTALNKDKSRCKRIGTHGNGGGVLCEKHHQQHVKKVGTVGYAAVVGRTK